MLSELELPDEPELPEPMLGHGWLAALPGEPAGGVVVEEDEPDAVVAASALDWPDPLVAGVAAPEVSVPTPRPSPSDPATIPAARAPFFKVDIIDAPLLLAGDDPVRRPWHVHGAGHANTASLEPPGSALRRR